MKKDDRARAAHPEEYWFELEPDPGFTQVLAQVDFSRGSLARERIRARVFGRAHPELNRWQTGGNWMKLSRASLSIISGILLLVMVVFAIGWGIENLVPQKDANLVSTGAATATVVPHTATPAMPASTFVTPKDGTNLVVRSGPGTRFDTVGQLKGGEKAPAWGRTSLAEWIKISLPGTPDGTGWVNGGLVNISGAELPIIADASAYTTGTRTGANLLGLQSSPEEIRNLILHPLWNVVWVDGGSVYHDPRNGTTFRFFVQAWLERTEGGRVISSDQLENDRARTPDIVPRWIWLHDGKTLQLYDTETKSWDGNISKSYRWSVHPLEMAGELMEILFPHGLERLSDQPIQTVREETFAGQSALVIDWGESRFWVDETSGVLLRQQDFYPPTDRTGPPQTDLYLSHILYAAQLPGDLFDSSQLDQLRFQETPPVPSALPSGTPTPLPVTVMPAAEKPTGKVYFSLVSGRYPMTDIGWLSLDCLAGQNACQPSIQTLPILYQRGMATALAWSPDGKQFALESNGDRNVAQDIFVVDANGKPALNLTHSPEREINPAWSPDGAYLLYVKTFAVENSTRSEIWVSRPDGADQRKIADGNVAAWSPDGRQILYAAAEGPTGKPIIAIADRSGGDPVWETIVQNSVRDLAWSPDGNQIVISSVDGLFRMDRDGSHATRLVPDLIGISNIAWSPDGQHIAFWASTSRQAPPNLYTIRVDGSSPMNLTNSQLEGYFIFSWSPDGHWLVYDSAEDTGHGNIFISNADGSVQYRLTRSSGSPEYLTPSWRPGS